MTNSIQQKRNFSRGLIELNLAIIFISTSGVLGRYIDLPIPITIGFRSLVGGLVLFLFCKLRGFDFRIGNRDKGTVFLGGLLLGLHWITYFYSLKLSNVAIGMLSLFTFPVITAILEPFILKTKILKIHLVLGMTILIGIYFLVPEFDLENSHFKAVMFGIVSAFCYALRNIIMKPKVERYNGSVLMVMQLLVITILLFPFVFISDSSNLIDYLPSNLLLAIMTTAMGHTLFLYGLKHFSTVSASIISCLQPVYGILFGMIFLKEYPEVTTIIGGIIIISSVLIESVRVYRLAKN